MRCLRAMALILSWLPLALWAAPPHLTPAQDLAADARDMRARGVVMLVLFSQAGCQWCERARTEVLIPLQGNPDSRQRVILREIALDGDAPLSDFAGRRTSHRRFAAGEGARVTPTLIVYGPDGARLSEHIGGGRLAKIQGRYRNPPIEESQTRIRAPSRGN